MVDGRAHLERRLPADRDVAPLRGEGARALALLALLPTLAGAQSLEPRLYVPLPVGTSAVIAAYTHSTGEVVVDAALPITDFRATINAAAAGAAHVFSLAGRTAQVQVVAPWVWGTLRAVLAGQDTSRTLDGPADPQLRLAVNLAGGPARRRSQLAGVRFGTIVGASLSVGVPLGEYDTARRINIGSHRWSVKPELGVVQPLGGGWALEGYAGVWLFSHNTAYLDTSTAAQEPLWTAQAHLIRLLGRRGYLALDGTIISGGKTTIDGAAQSNYQRNTRAGGTVVWSVARGHSLKASFSTGFFTRFGGDFEVFSVGYQLAWGG